MESSESLRATMQEPPSNLHSTQNLKTIDNLGRTLKQQFSFNSNKLKLSCLTSRNAGNDELDQTRRFAH